MDGAILMPCSDSTAQIGSTPHLSRWSSSCWAKTADAVSRISLARSRRHSGCHGHVRPADSGADAARRPRAARGGLHRVHNVELPHPAGRADRDDRGSGLPASPVDVLPEVMLGPFGLLDDAGAVTAAAVFVYKLVTVKRRLEDAGVKGRRRPDLLE